MKHTQLRFAIALSLLTWFVPHPLQAQSSKPWLPVGPDGGDARSFAAEPGHPEHIYLGTTDSWVYQSRDGGQSWSRLARLGKGEDLVIDNLLVDERDPRTLMAAAWMLNRPDGGLFISHDAGATWSSIPRMEGQSIRAIAQSHSAPKTYIAGTLKGVFRSTDGGVQWTQVSPPESTEIREVESIAIDPSDPNTIYAGTWHLPWKTTDGGAHWTNIKQGVIDDSDVFSIIIDPSRPSVVYASACSGIYRSDNAGELFHKVQGIPSTARRTRVLMQDPSNRSVVYAGTTEGLYKTTDDGANWTRMTAPDVIVNDVYVNPSNPQQVLLATDRGGVLTSSNAASSFEASNRGFSQRQVSILLPDRKDPQILYAGILNDKRDGGVFVSKDGGTSWKQQSEGLDGRDVYTLGQSADGMLLAGTNHGVYRWKDGRWQESSKVVNRAEKTTYIVRKGKRVKRTIQVPEKATVIDERVNSIDAGGPVWLAAATSGLYRSTDSGETWQGPVLKQPEMLQARIGGQTAVAIRRAGIALSNDAGATWREVSMPQGLTSLAALAETPDGHIYVGGREGLFYSNDRGQSWSPLSALPYRAVNGLTYSPDLQRILVTSSQSPLVLALKDDDKSWKWWNSGWNLHQVQAVNGRLMAASYYDGVLMEQQQESASAVPVGPSQAARQ